MKKIVSFFHHLFLPKKENNYQAKALHIDFLSFYLILALAISFTAKSLSAFSGNARIGIRLSPHKRLHPPAAVSSAVCSRLQSVRPYGHTSSLRSQTMVSFLFSWASSRTMCYSGGRTFLTCLRTSDTFARPQRPSQPIQSMGLHTASVFWRATANRPAPRNNCLARRF